MVDVETLWRLLAEAPPRPWAFGYNRVISLPRLREYDRLEQAMDIDAPDEDYAQLPEVDVCYVRASYGDTATGERVSSASLINQSVNALPVLLAAYQGNVMATCKQPDRDEPKLACGYPLPCPYHTIVMEEETMLRVLPVINWLAQTPKVALGTHLQATEDKITKVHVRGIAWMGHIKVWEGDRYFGLDVTMAELRDAWDELTREAHVALEQAEPLANEFSGIVVGDQYTCRFCGASHRRGPVDGMTFEAEAGPKYRCLGCGQSGKAKQGGKPL